MGKFYFVGAAVSCVLVLLFAVDLLAGDDGPSKLQLSGAEHYLKGLERQVVLAKGAPFRIANDGKKAMKRIRALHESHPSHPKVVELFERCRDAVLVSKGETMKITPEMLVYRENEKKLAQLFATEAETQWKAYREKILASGNLREKPFPSPSIRKAGAEEMIGQYVMLEDFEYPTNQFYDPGRESVHVGAGVKGYYFVDIANREWLGTYEAVKRYRRVINPRLPEGGKWTMVGRVVGLDLMVPSAGKKKVGPAHWGWRVLPEAIYVPDCTFAIVDGESELGGRFAGEERLEEIKAPMYTVRSVPDDVTPERLVEIFAAAIKEKNFELYVECVDPHRKQTRKALSRIRYHWDRHQERFARFNCHVTVVTEKTEVSVLRGFDEKANDEGYSLGEDEKEKIRERSDPLVEEGIVWTKAWNERGVQYGSERPHFLRRYEKKRWCIYNYSDPY